MSCILMIDGSEPGRRLLQSRLPSDVKIKFAPSLEVAWENLRKRKFDLILWDSSCDPSGQTNLSYTLETIATKIAGTKTIVFTDDANVNNSSSWGDHMQIEKQPRDDDEILRFIKNNLPAKSCANHNRGGKDDPTLSIEFEGILGISLPMREVVQRVLDAAAVDIPVLITGETGTGKDLIAAAIHKRSLRKDKPYIALNTGAMASELIASELFGHEKGSYTGAQDTHPGIFEQAHGGTVFLDEIATMNEKTQVSLLRVLEEGTFRRVGGLKTISADVRIIAATNERLETLVAEKKFREDLFYRLNVFPIAVPPLRERPGAVMLLTDHFVAKFAAVYGKEIKRVLPETYRVLRHYSWPGNVRELKNMLQTAVLMVEGKELTPDVIPQRIRSSSVYRSDGIEHTCSFSVGVTLDAVEKELIKLTLFAVNGNKKQTASILGISRRALYNKILRHQLT
jgi:two-component system, NtrC family, response regulator AtoC